MKNKLEEGDKNIKNQAIYEDITLGDYIWAEVYGNNGKIKRGKIEKRF